MSTAGNNLLHISWVDSAWIPILNPGNVMDYFAEKSNPFYDRTCNNEVVKMQRQSLEHLNNMSGIEYILLHVQDPILYVIRKQYRNSPNEVTPLADYHIIAGTVYQAPDLASVFNSRLLSTVHHLQSAFEEVSSYAKYHSSKGYSWDFSANKAVSEKQKSQTKKEPPAKVEPSSMFQRKRVDMLLSELLRKFPPPFPQIPQQATNGVANQEETNKGDNIKTEPAANQATENVDTTRIKTEPNFPISPGNANEDNNNSEIMKPPEKKMKI